MYHQESSFTTLFPEYLENYLREVWLNLSQTLRTYGIASEINLAEHSIIVKNTKKTIDPYIIIKATELIRLISRSVPIQQAVKVLRDDMYSEIIGIDNMIKQTKKIAKRKKRLIGPDGSTLMAIELLTRSFILIHGTTVCVMGSYSGIKAASRVVRDCFTGVHPLYHIKSLIVKKQLANDSILNNANWTNHLLKSAKKNPQRHTPLKLKARVVKKSFRSCENM